VSSPSQPSPLFLLTGRRPLKRGSRGDRTLAAGKWRRSQLQLEKSCRSPPGTSDGSAEQRFNTLLFQLMKTRRKSTLRASPQQKSAATIERTPTMTTKKRDTKLGRSVGYLHAVLSDPYPIVKNEVEAGRVGTQESERSQGVDQDRGGPAAARRTGRGKRDQNVFCALLAARAGSRPPARSPRRAKPRHKVVKCQQRRHGESPTTANASDAGEECGQCLRHNGST